MINFRMKVGFLVGKAMHKLLKNFETKHEQKEET